MNFDAEQKQEIKKLKLDFYPLIDETWKDPVKYLPLVFSEMAPQVADPDRYIWMTSLTFVAVVDKLYDIMKSENRKTIPFKFISLFVLKEFVRKCTKNPKFLQYLSEKVCNKLAKWCAEGRNTDDGATLFYPDATENGIFT